MTNSIILNALQVLGYILIFPGFLFCFLCGNLLAGINRKLVARMQKRVGPPILQPFYDFFKLCGKEAIIPDAASRTTFLMAPLIGFAALVVLQLFIPVGGFIAFSGTADIIVILYLLLIPAMAAMLGAAASGSPYAGVGMSREMVTIIACELPLVLVLLAIALIIPGETGSHPFDTAEAETEICEGMLAEYSGPPLAVYKLTHAVKVLTLSSLFVALFLGGVRTGIVAVDGVILFALCVVVVALFISLVHAVTARLKIEQVFKYYWTVVSGLALVSLVLAWYGL